MAIYSNVITNSSGSVGIGTTDVKEKLQVYGDLKVGVLAAGSFISLADESSTARYVGIYRSAGDTLLGLGAWGGIKFHASNTSLGSQTEWMRLDTSGRLGIGVTNPTNILTINKGNGTGINVQYDNATNVRTGLFLFTRGSSIGGFSGGSEWDDSTTTARSTAASSLLASAGTLLFYTNTGLTSGNTFTPSERMRIDTSGNVGIGTTIPGYPLHVYKSGLADGSTNTHLMFDGKFSVAGIDQNDMIGMSSRLENSGGGSQTTFNIGFSYQAGANAILLQPTSGYVGIGTNNPSSKLHVVSGDIRFDNTYGIIGATNTAGNVLRADGTRFVPAQLSYSDLSTTNMPVRTVSYTSITGATGDWYPLFKFGATDTTGAVVCTLSTASHSSVTFAVNRGWPGSNFYSISVLNCVLNPNGGFPVVTEIRVIADSAGTYDAQVEVKLVWSSGPTTNVTASVMASPMNVVFAASLATTAAGSASPGVSDSVVLSNNMMRAKGNIITPASVGIGVTNPDTNVSILRSSGGQFPSSGTTPTNAALRIKASANNAVYVGIDVGSPYGAWIQAADVTGFGATYPVLLNPNGGSVGIGTYNPSGVLEVRQTNNAGRTNVTFINPATASTSNRMRLRIAASGGFNGTDLHPYMEAYEENAGNAANGLAFGTYNGSALGERLRIDASGYVGIGKTNPAYTLDVTGDINYTSALKLGGVNVLFNTSTDVYANIRVLQNNSTSSGDGMYINYNSTGTSAANLRFYANGTNLRMQIDAATGHTLPGTDNAYDLGTSGVRWRTLYLSNTLSAATVTASGLTQGSVVFAGSGGTLSQDNTKLFWDNSNKRLGIGNSAPGYPLDVTGTSRYTGIAYYDGGESINLYGIRGRFSGEAMHLYNKVAIGYPSGWGGDISTTPIYGLSTYGGAILAYNQGTVGIGTATSSVRLYVHGSSTATTPTMLVKEGVASPTNGVLAFEVEKSTGATIFAVSGSGFVGVGTSNPAGTFEVVGVSGSLLLVTDNLSGSLFSVNDVTGLPILEVFSDDTVVAGRVNTNALVVTGSIVGIGTRTPSNTLDVNGTVRVRSVSNATGNFATYSGTGVLQQRTAAEVKTDLSLNNVQNLSVSQIFNNTGAVHSTRSDFANITDFGYQYVQGTTNGPNLNSATQYYAWTIGLGSEYSYANYGAQFAIPRAVANPYMGVRYREATTWSSWHKLAAGNADTLTTARTLWGQSFDGSGNVTGNLTSVGNITGTGAVTLTATGGTLGLTATGANVITATTNGTEALRINSSQNVGIGTATVGTRLHVHSGATDEVTRFESTGNPYISLYSTGLRQGYLYSNTSSVELVAENNKPLYLQSQTEIRLRTNITTDRVIINSGGMVGIGYTPPITTATSKLMVASDITLAKANASLLGNLYYDGAGPGWKYAANGYGWGFREDNAGKLQMVRAGNNTSGADAAASISLTDLFTFDLVNNRVGLGTGSPSTKLTVQTAADTVQIQATDGVSQQRVAYCGYGNVYSGAASNHPYVLLVNDTERMRIDTSGNVGINTSSMSKKLVVYNSDAIINGIYVGQGGSVTESGGVLSNVAVGYQAANGLTGNYSQTAVGYQSLYSNITGQENVAVGQYALYSNTSNQQVAIGNAALYSSTSVSGSTAVGHNALYSTTGKDNTAVGWYAGRGLTTGAGSVAIGTRSLRRGSGGLANTATGTTAVGAYALENGNASSGTTAVGWLAGGLGDMTGWYNTLVGGAAGAALTTAAGVTALGYGAMYFTTTGGDNTAIGNASLYKTTTGAFNVGLGNYSLYNNQVSYLNTAIGYRSLYTQTSGFSIVVGAATLSYGLNTAVGYETLVSSSSGYSNTAVGHSAGSKVTTGISNTLLGYTAGSEITTGNYNVVVGGYTAASFATSSNNIFLSDGAGNLRMIVDSSGNVGIGTSTTDATLRIARGSATNGTAMLMGTTNHSHFNYSTGEDTYIRGGKTTSKVYINDSTSSDVVIATGGGNVGIGTTQPTLTSVTSRLSVQTASDSILATTAIRMHNPGGFGATRIEWVSDPAGSDWRPGFIQSGDGGTYTGRILIYTNGSGVGTNWGSTLGLNVSNGKVRTGTTLGAPAYELQVNTNSAGKPGGGLWTDSSDERLKNNISPLSGSLSKLLSVRGVEFDWKIRGGHHAVGVIAQEVEKVFPEWVMEVDPSEEESQYVSDKVKAFGPGNDFFAYVIEAMRDLKTENDSLKSEIQSLKDQISSILAMLNNK